MKRIKDGTGKTIGEVWRYPRSHKFGLRLNGIYWDREGNANPRGGCTTKVFPRQRDAIAAAAAITG